MKKIPLVLAFLCSCKAAQVAAPSLDLETCSVKNSDFQKASTASVDYVWDCTPSNSAIYPQAFMFKSDGSACADSYDLEGNLASSSCSATWKRNSCSEVVMTYPSSVQTLGSITATSGGFTTSININDNGEDLGNQTYSCVQIEVPK